MAARRRPRHDDATARTRHLLALDAANVMRRLAARRDEMVTLFSRLRSREPMLETIQSWFGSISFAELSALPRAEQSAVNAFYASLEELRWYLRYTEDMPGTVHKTALRHCRRLELAFGRLVDALGPPTPDGAPVVDADVVARVEPAPRPVLASGSRPRRG